MFLKIKIKEAFLLIVAENEKYNFMHQPGFPGVDKTFTVALWSL